MSEPLTFCGCCDGVEHATPMAVENRPGLSALSYRIGTHGRFKASMQAAISEQPGLAALTTRDDADPTLALVDAWSVVLDVLSFYQERIANEHYLRTATERLSVLNLARRIGYELAPGVAASTTLAFTLQTGPGVPVASRVPVGTQAQSVPGQDEVPQTYETVKEITARMEWQAMRPRQRVPVPIWLRGMERHETRPPEQDGPVLIDPRPTLPGPVRPGPIDPGTVLPGPVRPFPIDPGTIDPGTIDPGTIRPGGLLPGPTDPGTIDPERFGALSASPGTPGLPPDLPGPLRPGLVPSRPEGLGPLSPRPAFPGTTDPRPAFSGPLGPRPVGPSVIELRPDLRESIETRWVRPGPAGLGREGTASEQETHEIWLKRVDLNLRPGDGLLLVGAGEEGSPEAEAWEFCRIREVTLDRPRVLTRIVVERRLGARVPSERVAAASAVHVFRQRAALFGSHAPDWRAMPDSIKEAYATAGPERDDPGIPTDPWGGTLTIEGVLALDGRSFAEGTVFLDTIYPEIVAEGWVVLARPGHVEACRVRDVAEDAREGYTLASKTTRLELSGEDVIPHFDSHIRDTVVFAVSEALERADAPLTDLVEGATVVLAEPVTEIAAGALVAIAGTDGVTGEAAAEVATVARVDTVEGLPRLTFKKPLAHRYAREDDADREVVGATLNANVARATHGKSVSLEVLGSGDGSVPFQRFTLKHIPLTYTAAGTASGAASTLEIRVNRVRWDEVPSLYQQAADARVYITRHADDGTVTVQFGDGIHGARLPTGVENVTASYRHGIGLGGLVDAGQIRLLMTRPLGIKDAANPEAPTGADDPERLDDARQNAPLTVLTLDRVVSVQDVEDFARAYAGIGKSKATVLWSGQRQIVHLTIAGVGGADVATDSTTYTGLTGALDAARHVHAEIQIEPHTPIRFGLAAAVAVDPAYLPEDVLAAVRVALEDAFSFEARDFAQSVSTAEVLATMQAVAGVVYVDLESLGGRDPFERPWIVSRPARNDGGDLYSAELLTIDPGQIVLTSTAP